MTGKKKSREVFCVAHENYIKLNLRCPLNSFTATQQHSFIDSFILKHYLQLLSHCSGRVERGTYDPQNSKCPAIPRKSYLSPSPEALIHVVHSKPQVPFILWLSAVLWVVIWSIDVGHCHIRVPALGNREELKKTSNFFLSRLSKSWIHHFCSHAFLWWIYSNKPHIHENRIKMKAGRMDGVVGSAKSLIQHEVHRVITS